MKIDLHVHIHRTSRCAKEEIEPMAIAAKACGLEGIVVLDHNYQATEEECRNAMQNVKGIKIFRGVEVNVFNDDVVIISKYVMDFLPKYKDNITDLDRLSKWVKETGSLAILAHPFRRHPDISFDLTKFKPDAIEILGRHVDENNVSKIYQLAVKENMRVVSISDAHKSSQLGGFCINLDNGVSKEEDLIDQIRRGNYTLMEKILCPVKEIPRGNVSCWNNKNG